MKRIEKIRTLADIGLDPAHAWALAFNTHNLAPEIYSRHLVWKRCRVLHEEYKFTVLLVTSERDDNVDDAVNVGDVFGYFLEYDLETKTYTERARSMGTFETSTGRFVDGIEMDAREYLSAKGAA